MNRFAIASWAGVAAGMMNVQTAAGQTEATGNSLTIYSAARPGSLSPDAYRSGIHNQPVPGYAVVRHERSLSLAAGRNTLRFSDVAALIDPTTVQFESLTDSKGTSVLEQNFQFDLVSHEKLLQRYIDRSISVDQVRGSNVESSQGTLLSTTGALVLRQADGTVQIVPSYAGVKLPELPGGLITRPTLVWDITAKQPGQHKTRVSYETRGITWLADYNLTYSDGANASACRLDVSAWVSIINQSGASYPDARLKLIAGDVRRIHPEMATHIAAATAAGAPAQFQQRAFFEYHLYSLDRRTTLPQNSTKQIELFPTVRNVRCEKTYLYYGFPSSQYGFGRSPYHQRDLNIPFNKKVDVLLAFRNSRENNMGMPLPLGRIRVSKLDEVDKTLEFIGEDTLDHTPKDERVLIKVGSAFDVVGERRQADFSIDTNKKTMTEEIEVKLRNYKAEPITVIVREDLYRWVTWEIIAKTHDYQKQQAQMVHFPVKIAPNAEAVVRYTARYTW